MNFFEFLVLLVNLFVDFRRVFILVLNCRFFFLSKLIFCIVDFFFNIFFWDIFIFFCFFRCERYFCWVLVEDIRSFFFWDLYIGKIFNWFNMITNNFLSNERSFFKVFNCNFFVYRKVFFNCGLFMRYK